MEIPKWSPPSESEPVRESPGITSDIWYLSMVESPGLSQLSSTQASPAWADRPAGLAGLPILGMAPTLLDPGPAPLSFTARTLNQCPL